MKLILRTLFVFTGLAFLLGSCQNEAAQIINAATHATPIADAGPSRTVYLPVSTTTLNGSGTSQNGHIVGYLWSMISGPNVPVIQTPGSAVTVLSSLVAGTYRFQLMVIDSAGYTGVDTASVNVYGVTPPPIQTLTLQPGSNPNELNFAVNGSTNISVQDIDLDAGAWTSSGNAFYLRGAMKFDLSSIPATATIISATLSLYSNPTPINGDQINANSGPNNSMWIRRLNAAFTSSSTWATQPTTETATQVQIPHTPLTTLDLPAIDVKNIVVSMMANGNYGFMMGLQNETPYNIRQFASSRNINATKRPKLVVVYQ